VVVVLLTVVVVVAPGIVVVVVVVAPSIVVVVVPLTPALFVGVGALAWKSAALSPVSSLSSSVEFVPSLRVIEDPWGIPPAALNGVPVPVALPE
jgi:hypothetical protein